MSASQMMPSYDRQVSGSKVPDRTKRPKIAGVKELQEKAENLERSSLCVALHCRFFVALLHWLGSLAILSHGCKEAKSANELCGINASQA